MNVNRILLRMAALFLFTACVLVPVSLAGAEGDDKTAAPSATVSFEHLALTQNETAHVEVWVSNPSASEMSVDLTISSPPMIEWFDESCKTPLPTPIHLRNIAAAANVHRTFCAKATSEIVVGDYNVLFAFEYRTHTQPERGGLVPVEKQVKLSFLGSDNIAGVPLAFACFVVPGLLFWLVLDASKGFAMDTKLGDKMIYSILVSLGIILVGSLIGHLNLPHLELFRLFSLSAGVSISKLFYLSLAGTVIGLAVGWGKRGWTWHKNKDKILATDTEQVVLRKLLKKHKALRKPLATVRLASEEYEGSLCEQTDTHTVLAGWFSFESPAGNKAEIDRMARAGRFADIVQWAERHQKEVKQYRPLRRKSNGGKAQDTAEYMKFWKNEEVEDERNTAQGSAEEAVKVT